MGWHGLRSSTQLFAISAFRAGEGRFPAGEGDLISVPYFMCSALLGSAFFFPAIDQQKLNFLRRSNSHQGTTVFITLDDGVYEFTLGDGNKWICSRDKIQIKTECKIFAPANMRAAQEVDGYNNLIQHLGRSSIWFSSFKRARFVASCSFLCFSTREHGECTSTQKHATILVGTT